MENYLKFFRGFMRKKIKVLRIMKLTLMLLIVGVLQLSANVYSQNGRINVQVTEVELTEFLWELQQNSEVVFVFKTSDLEGYEKISLTKEDASITEILDEVLVHTDLEYKLDNDVIVITKKQEENTAPEQQEQQKAIRISGKVVDAENGELLPGVNVSVKGSYLGTITGPDGKFKMVLPTHAKTLVFSFIGYESQEVQIEGKKQVEVFLQHDVMELSDVVVTGYQVVNKRELTSAISSVEAKDLDMVGSLSIDKMLEGKATGLMITNLSATPGAAAKVRVRGGSTFTGNQSPLWVIDGIIYEDPVPLSADDINSFDNINIIGNALSGINPTDIARIDILKDASATAIYGTRAANGVIVISTKRGEKGKPTINYSGSLSITQAPEYDDFNLMNSKERIDVSREMYERNLGYPGQYDNVDRLGYEGALMNLWDGVYNFNQFQDQVSYLETLNADWFGELYRPAITHRHSVSASGGGDNVRYYFSLGYDDEQGSEEGVDLDRITARSNLDLDLRENVLLSFQLSGSVQEGHYNHSSINPFNTAYYTSRTIPIYDMNGEYYNTSKEIFNSRNSGADNGIVYGRYNIFNEMNNSERNITNKEFTISASLRWDFLKDFRFTSQASYRNTTNLTEEWITEDTWYVASLRTYDRFEDMINSHVNEGTMAPFGGVYSGGMVSQKTYAITNQLNYKKVFNEKHVFNVNLGQEARSTKYWGATGFTVPGYNHSQGRGFIELPYVSGSLDTETYDYENMIKWLAKSGGQSVYPSITDKVNNAMSYFGIVSYVYDNRYVFNFNMRSDGSNAFGQYERYKFKPAWSVSSRWNIHNEKFWNGESKIDELAFRASYGVRGTMPNTSPYLTISDYGRNNAVYYPETTASLSDFPNANIRWEKTETVNLGLNYSFFNGRISGAFDYAYSKSNDLILSRPVSLVNGASTQQYNGGSKDVSSYEFAIRSVNIKTNKFAWNTSFNFSYDKNRVLKGFEDGAEANLTVANYLQGNIYRSGFPTNGFFSYQFDGLNEVGLPTFKHLEEENMSPDEQLRAALVYEGSRVPLYYGGFGTEFRYGNLRLSANFTYKLDYKTRLLSMYNGNQNLPLPYENMHSNFNNRWRQPGDEANTNIPALSSDNMAFSNTGSTANYDRVRVTNYGYVVPQGQNAWWMYDNSDVRTVDADHIRLQSISLSYSVPNQWIKKSGLKSMRIGVQANNVAVWAFDKDLKGQDPEQVNNIGMPSLSTYSLSLNVSF